jgi:peptide/nickel transport system ATP-binding protein
MEEDPPPDHAPPDDREGRSMSAPPRLKVCELRVELEATGEPVVEDISFTLPAGHALGLVGESGSGKTTVGLATLGYARRGLRLAGGSVVLDGEHDLLAMPKPEVRALRGDRVAYVPQDPATALNPARRVGAQLRETLRVHGIREHGDDRLREILTETRLDPDRVLGAYPHQLSGGQQQRVALAMAFSLQPGVIVLDEPTTGLDVSTQRHILDTVRELCATHGVAALFVSHDLAVVSELVDEVAVMYAGRLVERAPRPALFGAPAHPYTRGLLRALPSPEQAHLLIGLPGQPPAPGRRDRGCTFAARCAWVEPRCGIAEPSLRARLEGDEHLVRCLRADDPAIAAAESLSVPAPPPGASRPDPRPLLAVSDLRAGYATVEVVHGVDLALDRGRCLAIVGESGSGKTTLARCIVGLHRNWTGDLALEGHPLVNRVGRRSAEDRRTIQFVFQNPYGSLNPRRSVGDIVDQALRQFFDLSSHDREDRVVAALRAVSLDPGLRDRHPAQLSGGERQRVAIARALAAEPRILVCDEITSALDVSVQATIIELLRGLQSTRGLSLLFITHNLALVRSLAQDVVVLRDGVVVESGAASTVLDSPGDDYTERLLLDVPRLAVTAA